MSLEKYQRKRKFQHTAEPKGAVKNTAKHRFVVQEHHASRLHFDFRLEMAGVLKSWALPKGPSLDPAVKRLAVEVEDHPVDYINFEGQIAEGNYGAGEVIVWDSGTYELMEGSEPAEQWEAGRLKFALAGKKLKGEFNLVRLSRPKQWLLMKGKDVHTQSGWELHTLLKEKDSRTQEPARRTRQPARRPARTQANKSDDAEDVRKGKRQAANERVKLRKGLSISHAVRALMPKHVEPMLATLVDQPFDDEQWLFETKWDGVRAISFVSEGKATFISRNDREMGFRYPELADIASALALKQGVLDGEIVVFDERGRARFQALQQRIGLMNDSDIQQAMRRYPAFYYVFDLLYVDEYDLMRSPLEERKEVLRSVLGVHRSVKFSEHTVRNGQEAFKLAQSAELEGIIAKKRDSAYVQRRSDQWLKIKTQLQQEVVIGGYTAPRKSREYFGALVAGVYNDGALRYVGHVGGGFNRRSLQQTFEALQPLKTERAPFADPPKTNEPVQWVQPRLVGQVKFAEWTHGGIMRQPIFLGLRDDKDPRDVEMEREHTTEREVAKAKAKTERPHATKLRPRSGRADAVETISLDEFIGLKKPSGDLLVKIGRHVVSLTHLDKLYWPDDNISKGELLQYYARTGEYILPHLKDRALILIRYPNGITQRPFFQHEVLKPPAFVRSEALEAEVGRVIDYAIANNLASLLYVVNLGTITQNPWLSRVSKLEYPDWVVFDLDPEDVGFDVVCEVALATRDVLDDLGLAGYAKTSGSRGMHVFVPLKPVYTYEQVADFAELVALLVTERNPDCATVQRSLKRREAGHVYVDYLQNAKGKSVASVYSARAKAGAPVSMPLEWTEVNRKLDPSKFNITTVGKRIKTKGELFKHVFDNQQSLSDPIKRLDKLIKNRHA